MSKPSRRQREERRSILVICAVFALVLIAGFGALWWTNGGGPIEPMVTVYRSETCQCCERWVRQLAAQGFRIRRGSPAEWAGVRAHYGLPPALQACHTAVVEGLLIEGHVPAADVRKLLANRHGALGLVLPGMPAGSPGMESAQPEPYTVLALYPAGEVRPFSRHQP